ncbi:hypothetical protein [Streptomyces sp. NPDC049040]|uniref:hypothetical protein n=1 Tax=Streptomyces sp. NPDC049040 TaxID=3365593 RepID=UPI0037164A7D
MSRADLRALTPATLAALSNRGLVKRAEKDLAAGAGPAVSTAGDGAVQGIFPDGTRTVLPPAAGLDAATCTCGAAGVCRHRIALVLAYQETGEDTGQGAEQPSMDWSPAEFDDAALAAALGRPALTAARRTRERGFSARVHRPVPEDPVPRVELPACTVSFPVPHELGYALTDAADALRGEVVSLAVWAFRAADAEQAEHVTVGGGAADAGEDGPEGGIGGEAALDTAVALAGELLLDGVKQAGPVFAASLLRCREALAAAARHWPAGAVAELQEQVAAYAARGTRYDPERFALLLAELHSRQRAAGRDPVGVLGTDEPPSTPLRRVRLVALGCRISGSDRDRTAETYFAHPDAGIALVLRKRWDLMPGQEPTGGDLGGRRLLGSPLRALAAANVVSEHTARSADRTITISRGRIAATGITPVGTAWTELPAELLVRDAAAHLRALGERPPRLIRPRVEAENARVVAVSEVESFGYDPAAQLLEAVLRDAAGNEVVVRAEHNPFCPASLDALAAALAGRVHCVSGVLHRDRGRVLLDPLAVLTPTGVIVPDLAPGAGDTVLPAALAPAPADPLTDALVSALAVLADAAHQGLRHLTARTRLTAAATRLHRTGLLTAARHLRALDTALDRQGATAAVPAWVDATVHLAATLELHQEAPAGTGGAPPASAIGPGPGDPPADGGEAGSSGVAARRAARGGSR